MSPIEGYDPTERVTVTRQHLQEWLAALSWAHSYFSALDLADGYRNGRQQPSPSKSTSLLARAFNHAEGYLYDAEAEPVPNDFFISSGGSHVRG